MPLGMTAIVPSGIGVCSTDAPVTGRSAVLIDLRGFTLGPSWSSEASPGYGGKSQHRRITHGSTPHAVYAVQTLWEGSSITPTSP
jgi:hypothetical protein